MSTYKGKNGKEYELGKKIGAGGEGTVYQISNPKGYVAKVFHAGTKDANYMQRKIETMISMPVKSIIDDVLRIAWPEDILLDGTNFVGYVMPEVTAPYEIFYVYKDNAKREQILPGYTWKNSVQFAYNLSWIVWYLHMNGVIIGDLNEGNICIGSKGQIVLIDCDSFDITNPKTKEHFPCTVGLQEMLAPELQCVGSLANGKFSKESDDFSLAIHIFRLLMKNANPFWGTKLISKEKLSKHEMDISEAIMNGECVYVRSVPDKVAPSWVPPFDMLPKDIQEAFRRTFNYTSLTAVENIKNRTTAEEWTRVLLSLARKEQIQI